MKIILAGMPGKVASVVASVLPQELLHSSALCSDRAAGQTWNSARGGSLKLIRQAELEGSLVAGENYVALDFSPVALTPERLDIWVKRGIPVVVGATGFNLEEVNSRLANPGHLAMFAPNLAMPIVALQAILKDAAERYPGAFEGLELSCTESHQATKKDVSGTARALMPSLAKLGFQGASAEHIRSIRNPDEQRALGVPEEFLPGHGWHRYEAVGQGISLALEHRVNGRAVYALGAEKACRFLLARWGEGLRGKVLHMTDLLLHRS